MRGSPGTGQSAPRRSLVRLPKAHLHLHLDGSMRPTTLRALAEAQAKIGVWLAAPA